jgi:hypothetical protein
MLRQCQQLRWPTKLDCLAYLKGQLNFEFAKIMTTNVPAAQILQRCINSADHIDDGCYQTIWPFYDTCQVFLSVVKTLNSAIVSGASSPANFNEYVVLLVAALKATDSH